MCICASIHKYTHICNVYFTFRLWNSWRRRYSMRSARLPLMVRAHKLPEMLVSCFVRGSNCGVGDGDDDGSVKASVTALHAHHLHTRWGISIDRLTRYLSRASTVRTWRRSARRCTSWASKAVCCARFTISFAEPKKEGTWVCFLCVCVCWCVFRCEQRTNGRAVGPSACMSRTPPPHLTHTNIPASGRSAPAGGGGGAGSSRGA